MCNVMISGRQGSGVVVVGVQYAYLTGLVQGESAYDALGVVGYGNDADDDAGDVALQGCIRRYFCAAWIRSQSRRKEHRRSDEP